MNPLAAVFPKSILRHLDEVERRIQTKAQSREPNLGALQPLPSTN